MSDSKHPPLRSVGGGSDWPAGVPDAMREMLEDALRDSDRVIMISIRRNNGTDGVGVAINSFCDRRVACRVSWLEMLGALHKKLHDWTADLGDEDC